ncbi:hypothetical protein SAMN05444487_1184 [Marininema mesophilum]|uniref:Uncharacterized protein n=1 Tax=Marininema mesophilum TaxID=1048340 RepID=A0A1H3BRP0_9BACL|nr:hypothetical protein [Marininema mesophilum]SDX44398.1 hypothetical protein SAMN05444487_1184 [Marininema mesophilum]
MNNYAVPGGPKRTYQDRPGGEIIMQDKPGSSFADKPGSGYQDSPSGRRRMFQDCPGGQ